MKLGTETGSLINHLYSRTITPEPEVGMGATKRRYGGVHGLGPCR